ncbi:NAD(P)/FAD-dependent oxidoreductase [Parachitinimonas caeni]|uniref:FAD/NAD(P)-binding oxidoreductase n=1 Tax=Parachitinimonas caeni TaxID=3031301 RepID=A0ABT7DSB7_9NEIS|nr:FAD/NAD(P)-binding oxidoreductase [Parachitinimonas caeni]MDK2122959.1 FAD/NAD(P)-binding oxidoreductase [Parachitinimonas caeni]
MRELATELAIVGAGPAGLAAAEIALRHGMPVCLIDDNPAPGGQIWRGGQAGAAMAGHPKLRLLTATRVVAAPAPNCLLLESADGASQLSYHRLLLANGARERLLPFPGWTLPGVTGAGGLQALVKSGLDVRGKKVIIAGSGPLLLATALSLKAAGAQVIQLAEQASLASVSRFALHLWHWPGKLTQALMLGWQLQQVPYAMNTHVRAALGNDRLQAVRLRRGDEEIELACDWLAVGYGLLPNLELARALGCKTHHGVVEVDHVMRTSRRDVFAAGELTGIGGVDKAQLEGRIAGLLIIGEYDRAVALAKRRRRWLRFAAALEQHFSLQPAIAQLASADTVVCRCEDVRFGRLAKCGSWREAKLHTRCGMGPCQGRLCGAACETLFGWQNAGSRPPVFPARLDTLAGNPSTAEVT